MFGRIHADLVTELVLEQPGARSKSTRVVARSALSREFVEFFEQQVRLSSRQVLVIGGTGDPATYDRLLVFLCVA